jgi:TatD DNase family protein
VLVDSHCHLNFPDLAADLDGVMERMLAAGVTHALCVCVNLRDLPQVLAIAERYPNVYASVGVHPDEPPGSEPHEDDLVELARHPRVVAIGETGLDYYHHTGDAEWQRARFKTHIRAARMCGKPLIVHTRAAAEDTLSIMTAEGAAAVGGVMHCFTESFDIAQRAMNLNFHISISGIVTFKNAVALKQVSEAVPLQRLLIETDAPYLAPVPFRGKTNEPAYVRYVAEEIGRLKGISAESVAEHTTANFFSVFKIARQADE